MDRERINIWWGPPKKFSTVIAERKISWLELFYDLVYVIVISRITHILATHTDLGGLIGFFYLFMLAFWGWANGSQYHDLHGSPGIRTRFMTLWQMMAAAALAVTLNSPDESLLFRSTIALIVLQGYITYLWWSVGIYDKEHRRLSRPYIGSYLASFILLIVSLFTTGIVQATLYAIIPILNFAPPFFNEFRRDSRFTEFKISPALVERLGLITIIVFGEAILGVINGVNSGDDLSTKIWLGFGLGILIVFLLWWIFFSIVADREVQKGFWYSQLFILSFVPILAALGAVGATFSVVMGGNHDLNNDQTEMAKIIFGSGLAVFLWSILSISKMLLFPASYEGPKQIIQWMLAIGGLLIFGITILGLHEEVMYVFLANFIILLTIVVSLVRSWFKIELKNLD